MSHEREREREDGAEMASEWPLELTMPWMVIVM